MATTSAGPPTSTRWRASPPSPPPAPPPLASPTGPPTPSKSAPSKSSTKTASNGCRYDPFFEDLSSSEDAKSSKFGGVGHPSQSGDAGFGDGGARSGVAAVPGSVRGRGGGGEVAVGNPMGRQPGPTRARG